MSIMGMLQLCFLELVGRALMQRRQHAQKFSAH